LFQVLVGLSCCTQTWAGNGINLIGFGTESVGMGGADIAVARDTTALNTNPAGLTQLRGAAFDGYISNAFALDVAHADRFGNDRKVDNDVISIGGGGYARPLGSTGLVAGFGFFAQGGAGNVYKDLHTPFGGTDEVSGLFGIVRLMPGIAWRMNDQLSIGASAAITHAMAKQRVFAGVSVSGTNPSQNFFGTIVKDLQSTELGGRFGVQYALTPALSLAAVYAPKTELPLKKGHADVNMTALGLGIVRYEDARLTGLALPQEIGVGTAWKTSPSTLISFELTWLDWAGALKSQTLRLADPRTAGAPRVIEQTARLDWKDQYVFALGMAHDVNERLTLYGGFNYGRRPARAETTSPLLSAAGEKHVTGGFRLNVAPGWLLSGALEYLFKQTVTYDNPELPFGPGAQERNNYIAVHAMLSRRW
jgi:long-chain fatty acid transport protein